MLVRSPNSAKKANPLKTGGAVVPNAKQDFSGHVLKVLFE